MYNFQSYMTSNHSFCSLVQPNEEITRVDTLHVLCHNYNCFTTNPPLLSLICIFFFLVYLFTFIFWCCLLTNVWCSLFAGNLFSQRTHLSHLFHTTKMWRKVRLNILYVSLLCHILLCVFFFFFNTFYSRNLLR